MKSSVAPLSLSLFVCLSHWRSRDQHQRVEFIWKSISLSLSICTYICVCVCVSVYVCTGLCMYVCTYIHINRDRDIYICIYIGRSVTRFRLRASSLTNLSAMAAISALLLRFYFCNLTILICLLSSTTTATATASQCAAAARTSQECLLFYI